MISIYNKAILKELNPALLEKLEELETEGLKKARVLPSQSGEKTLAYEENGKTYFLHSRYQPSYEAEKAADSYADITNEDSVVFYGVGLGYHIKEMLKRVPEIKYYLIEPNLEVLYVFLENNELKDLNLVGLEAISVDYDDLERGIPNFMIKYPRELRVVLQKNTVDFFADSYDRFKKLLLLSLRKERDNTVFFVAEQLRTVVNEFQNMEEVLSTGNILLQDLSDIKGKTVILVAAGPSLEDEIENLRVIKEKGLAYIFTVGSAVNTLISKGIHPDAVFSYDPSVLNQRVVQKIKENKITDIPLVYGAGVGFETLIDYPGTKLHMLNSNNTTMKFFLKVKERELPIVRIGATITAPALDASLKMGFGNVIFVGQNLGITDNRAYSSGIDYVPEEIRNDSQYTEKEKDVEGNLIRTSPVYLSMREGLEAIIQSTDSKAKIWNATKKGLAIAGAEFKPLSELMQNMKAGSVSDRWLKKIKKSSYDIEHLEKKRKEMTVDEEQAEKEFSNFKRIMNEIKKQGELEFYQRLPKYYIKLNLSLKRLETNKYSLLYILSSMLQEYHNLVLKIEFFNSIKDQKQQFETIYSSFNEFVRLYEERLEGIKPYSKKMNEVLQEYMEKVKENN